jgi:UDP-N-acetylglucosamine--N-acetylmuramyl-(pentapeptide) pyrophosphoryl-undecaprenol N-acetylglucosamine transferase
MLATCEALKDLDQGTQITCVGTAVGLETTLVPEAGFELALVDPVPLPRQISTELFTLPARIWTSQHQATEILKKAQAEVVVGFGGYVCVPVYLAAWRMRIPTVVHEANAVPGLANRIGSRFAKTVCVTFASTGLKDQVVTGMPMRQGIATLDRAQARTEARRALGILDDDRVLLVSGGSQGALRLNEATMGALASLDAAGIRVLHVTGKGNFETAEPIVAPDSYVRLPYVEKMEQAYAAADLMLARSGAATVTETACVGLPTIYVPLPHGNGEQAKNAADVIEAGGGILIADADLTSERLIVEVTKLFADEDALTTMSRAARGVTPNDAAIRVAGFALAGGHSCHL